MTLKSFAKDEGIPAHTTPGQGTIHSRKDATETARVMLDAGWGLDKVSAQTKEGLRRYLTIREYSRLSAIARCLATEP